MTRSIDEIVLPEIGEGVGNDTYRPYAMQCFDVAVRNRRNRKQEMFTNGSVKDMVRRIETEFVEQGQLMCLMEMSAIMADCLRTPELGFHIKLKSRQGNRSLYLVSWVPNEELTPNELPEMQYDEENIASQLETLGVKS
jgi:hypothetical protein